MAGISDKAIKTNYAENKYRYNSGTELQNKEFSDGTGLETYETGFRMLDPQLGRFTQIDPLADMTHFQSAYQFADNDPVSGNDPTGLFRQYQPPPTMQSGSYYNVLNNFGLPTIDQINQTLQFYDEMGAAANGGGGGVMSQGNGVYQLPNGDIVDEWTATNYALSTYGGTLESYSGGLAKVMVGLLSGKIDPGDVDVSVSANSTGMQVLHIQWTTLVPSSSTGTPVEHNLNVPLGAQGYPLGFQQFIAIAVGESGDGRNQLEIEAIASSMINRINQASTSLYDPKWLKKISYGGNINSNFQIIKRPNQDYKDIMSMTIGQIIASKNPGIQAAIIAYNNWDTDYSNPQGYSDTGQYYWNSSSNMANSQYNNNPNNFVKTLIAGGTTFYRPK
jgi:RHS repeat-associated protein